MWESFVDSTPPPFTLGLGPRVLQKLRASSHLILGCSSLLPQAKGSLLPIWDNASLPTAS